MRRSFEHPIACEWFWLEPVSRSQAIGLAIDDPRVYHCGGTQWVIGVYPSAVPNPKNGNLVSVMGYDTPKFFAPTKYIHPHRDGLLAYGRAFFVGNSRRDVRDRAWQYVYLLNDGVDVAIEEFEYNEEFFDG